MIIAHLGAPWRTFALRRDPQGCQQFSMLDTLPARFKRTRQVPVVGGEAAISGTDGSLVVCKGVGDRLALELLIGPPRAAAISVSSTVAAVLSHAISARARLRAAA